MCGICGVLDLSGQGPVERDLLVRMGERMQHRGPDGSGAWSEGPVGLGHRRLTIIDLSTGAQPLTNEDGSVHVVFNGEIYNYRELTAELVERGHRFSTTSDTEVLVHLWEEHGTALVERLNGMFAFALWDDRRRTLLLARDRVGIKPLYWARRGDLLLFASELKVLLEHPAIAPELEPRTVDRFLRFDYVPGEDTLLRGVHKLAPGHRLLARVGTGEEPVVERYWDLAFPPAPGPEDPPGGLEDAVRRLDGLLRRVVEEHLVADVPVGFLSSGGLDSTALLSYAAEAAGRGEISTFTVGFDGGDVPDERRWARLAAERFGTVHHEITVPPDAFGDFLPRYVWHMEEPVCEPPAIALFHVSELAARHVKVVLSGEGGDEAFAGYRSYAQGLALEGWKRRLGPLRGLAGAVGGRLAEALGRPGVGAWARRLGLPLEEHYRSRTSHPFRWYPRHVTHLFTADFRASLDPDWSVRPALERFERAAGSSDLSRMLYVDSGTWLPDDLLVKADKMTMASSLELRVPLLDHRVLEFAAGLPDRFKLEGRDSKRVLRRLCAERVPREILERPKAGFPVPYGRWLRTSLREMVRELLLGRRSRERGMLEPRAVEQLLLEHENGRDRAKEVFSLVVLELWLRAFLDGDGRAPSAEPARSLVVG